MVFRFWMFYFTEDDQQKFIEVNDTQDTISVSGFPDDRFFLHFSNITYSLLSDFSHGFNCWNYHFRARKEGKTTYNSSLLFSIDLIRTYTAYP